MLQKLLALIDRLRANPRLSAPPPRHASLFSTEIDGTELSEIDWQKMMAEWEKALKKSFQRLPSDFKPVDSNGKQIEGNYRIAAAAPGVPGKFAMDSPSEGNPLSMKPLIEPIFTIPFAQLIWYSAQGFIGYQACAIIAQHWLVDKICTVPARDAMRHWYEIATEDDMDIDPKIIADIKKLDRKYGIKQNCVELLRFNRIFGIRIALPIIENQAADYWEQPFDPAKIKPGSYKGISQIDPYWITPELDGPAAANPASISFYEPTWWRVNGQRVHRTHLILIRNGKVSDILKPTYLYGGVSIPQKIAERVYASERTANEAPQMALTKRTTFMKVDITQALANLETFLQKINFFTQMRDNYGLKIGGLDDTLEQFDTSLNDFDATIMTQYEIACAAGDCPSSKIMGTSPKGGLGTEGTYDADSYHEFLESLQEHDAQPLIERHHLLCMLSEILPKYGSKVPTDFMPVITWNPCDTPTAKEQAEINYIKAQTAAMEVTAGAIDGVDERTRLASDKDSGYNGLNAREPDIIEPDDNPDEPDNKDKQE